MAIDRLSFHWFSGTGNTRWALHRLEAHLVPHGIAVEAHPLPGPPPEPLPETTALGLAFPVYAQGPPPFVVRWLRALPVASRPVPVVVLSTMAGMSGLVKGPLARILRAKGYRPWAVRELRMPPNYIHQLGNPRQEATIRHAADAALAKFAEQLANNTAAWPWRPPMPGGLACAQAVFRPLAGWLGHGFRADPDRCTRCELCVRLCPVGNIRLAPPSPPTFAHHCEQCLRCLNHCPADAIAPHRLPFLFRPPYHCPDAEIAAEVIPRPQEPPATPK
jgi:ferredoxin